MKKTFTKEERLCGKVLIDNLFSSGSSFLVYPIRIVFKPLPKDNSRYPAQSIISVSKRRFKRAHDRNRIKRLLREVYRQQKSEFLYTKLEELSLNLNLAIQFIGKEEFSYTQLYEKMNKALKQISNELSK